MERTSINIQTELDQTISRLSELKIVYGTLEPDAKKTQDRFVSGKSTLAELQTEQSKVSLLNDSVNALRRRRDDLQTELTVAAHTERQSELCAKLVSTGNEAEPLVSEYLELRNQFHSIIADSAAKLVGKLEEYHNKQREYAQTFEQLDPEINVLDRIHSEDRQRYADINRHLESIGLTTKARDTVTASRLDVGVLPYGECIALAESILINNLDRERQQERDAARSQALAERPTKRESGRYSI